MKNCSNKIDFLSLVRTCSQDRSNIIPIIRNTSNISVTCVLIFTYCSIVEDLKQMVRKILYYCRNSLNQSFYQKLVRFTERNHISRGI